MNKLGALDASFLYNETARSPQQVASVQILELPADISEGQFVEQLKSLLMERIHLVPYFTNKLQFVPFNLDHPIWINDLDFHIDNHVRTLEVPAPGGRAELEATIAGLHETRLDRNRPLWDLWVLTGLEDGRIAYYNRAHHACLDGISGQAMLETIMDVTPEPRTVEPAPAGFFTERDQQSAAQLMSGAVENFAKFQAKQPLAAFNSMGTAARLFQRTFDPRKGLGAVSQRAPATRFNKAVEKKRSYAVGEISLDSVKTVAKHTHSKINDVFLAACAGGLRRYLDRTGELPTAAMIAGCPVSMRLPGDTSTNNQVSMMLVSLATDESDPAERLQKIAQSSRTAKGFTQDVARSYDADVAMPGLPAAMTAGVGVADLTRMANRPGTPLASNVVVSNVPGPQQTLYSCGAKVLTHYPVSIPADTQAVNITVQSYAGTLYFASTACAKALPDADVLRDDILIAYQELKALYDLPTVAVALQQREAISSARKTEKSHSQESDDQPKAA